MFSGPGTDKQMRYSTPRSVALSPPFHEAVMSLPSWEPVTPDSCPHISLLQQFYHLSAGKKNSQVSIVCPGLVETTEYHNVRLSQTGEADMWLHKPRGFSWILQLYKNDQSDDYSAALVYYFNSYVGYMYQPNINSLIQRDSEGNTCSSAVLVASCCVGL